MALEPVLKDHEIGQGPDPIRALLSLQADYMLGGGYPDIDFQRNFVWDDFFLSLAERYESPKELMHAIDPEFEEWVNSLLEGAYETWVARIKEEDIQADQRRLNFTGHPEEVLGYGETRGYKLLVEKLADIESSTLGINVSLEKGKENFLMLTGSQQGLFLFAKRFLPGRKIAVANQVYLGAIPAFKDFADELVAIKTDEKGLDVDDLESKLRGDTPVQIDAVYVVPFGDNPTGVRFDAERMKKLHQLADEFKFNILLDRAYECTIMDRDELDIGEYLLQDDKEMKHTLLLSSFSKSLMNGRLAYVIGNPENIKWLTKDASSVALHPPMVTQIGIYGSILKKERSYGSWDNYLKAVAEFYHDKNVMMGEALKPSEKFGIRWLPSSEGFFWFGLLPEGADSQDFLKDWTLKSMGVDDKTLGFAHGYAFMPVENDEGKRGMRLAYSRVPKESIMDAGAQFNKKAEAYLTSLKS